MKLTEKFKKQIRDAVLEAVCKLYDERCPECKDSPPEFWSFDTKHDFNLITEVEIEISKVIGKVFDENS